MKEKKRRSRFYPIGPYEYIPKFGFYLPNEKKVETEETIEPDQVADFLESSLEVVQKLLKQYLFNKASHSVSYAVHLDTQNALHIDAYLFSLGDLQPAKSHYFGDWVFIANKGFFKIEPLKFNSLHTLIRQPELSQFILQHKAWLGHYVGYEVHVAKIEQEISYEIDKWGSLIFHSASKLVSAPLRKQMSGQSIDIGNWLILRAKAFFSSKRWRRVLL